MDTQPPQRATLADAIVLDVWMRGTQPGDPPSFTVTVENPAIVRWDLEAGKRGFPPKKQAKQLYGTFLAWAQLVQQGDYPGTIPGERRGSTDRSSWRQFHEADCIFVAAVPEQEPVGPTVPEPDSGPSSPSQPAPG